jgi:hypothetical protein
MNLVLEVTPAVERALEQKARRRGVALETYAAQVLEREAVETTSEEAQSASTQAAPRVRLLGILAGRERTVEDFLREKHEEIEREEAEWERRHAMSTHAGQSQPNKDTA